jgi:hypothetical protein
VFTSGSTGLPVPHRKHWGALVRNARAEADRLGMFDGAPPVLFHFALMQELPATAYLSRADKLMMAVYACLFLHMLSSWIWFVFDEKHIDMLFKWAKYICGPITLIFMACGILL